MRNPKDIKIGERTLAEILKDHQHFINRDCEDWEEKCADLRLGCLNNVNLQGADLRGINFRGADLRDADLHCTNLDGADLLGVDLRKTDLQRANLQRANLQEAFLQGANLRGANLRGANFYKARLNRADFNGASLQWANLKDAEFTGADLWDADLYGAKGNLIDYRKGKTLTKNIVGYKKCERGIIVTLEIPKGAIVFSINGNKCRTNKAKVIAIDGSDRAISLYKYFSYYVGDEINIYDFDCEYNVECGKGIHFFMTKEEAKNYF